MAIATVFTGQPWLSPKRLNLKLSSDRPLENVVSVGILFCTFQTLRYTIDIDHKELEHAKELTDFAFHHQAKLGLAAAMTNLESLGRVRIEAHMYEITCQVHIKLDQLPGVTMLSEVAYEDRTGIIPFKIDGWEAHAAASVSIYISDRDFTSPSSSINCWVCNPRCGRAFTFTPPKPTSISSLTQWPH